MTDIKADFKRERIGSRIVWLSSQVLDLFLSKTAYIEISKNLAELGNQVDFFAIRSKTLLKSDSPNMHLLAIPLRRLPYVAAFSYVVLASVLLPFYILMRKPDFVILEPKFGSTFFSLVFRLFPSSLRPILIMDVRSTPVEVHTLHTSINSFWFNSSVITARKIFDGFTVASEEMKKELCSKFNMNPESMRVWRNGVDLRLFSPGKYDGAELRMKLGLKDQFIVFYHGSFRPNGGITETIKGIKLLEDKCPDLVLFLLGGGPALQLYKQTIQENHIQNRVIIHPPVDYAEVPKYIAIGNVGIVPLPDIPDWRNQSPLKLIEYLAMKKRVIATDIPANRGLTGGDKCVTYLSSVNPDEIAKAIEFAYERKEKLESCEASEILIGDYDWKKVAEKFVNYLRDFAKARDN